MIDQDRSPSLSHPRRVALLVMALDKEVLAKVLKHLNETELARLSQIYDAEGRDSSFYESDVIGLAREFIASTGRGPQEHLKDALVLAVGSDGASQIMRQDPWRAIAKRITPGMMAELLKEERPETVGIVLSRLPTLYGAELLEKLPEQIRAQSVERLTRNSPIAEAAADALAAALEDAISGANPDADVQAGIKAAAAMLNRLESDTAQAIVEQLRVAEPMRAEALERAMFHFENLLTLDSRVLERILSEVQTDKLTTALKGLSTEHRDIVLAALTDQVKAMVIAELDESGPTAAADVRAARREISSLALRLEQEGKVRLHPEEAGEMLS